MTASHSTFSSLRSGSSRWIVRQTGAVLVLLAVAGCEEPGTARAASVEENTKYRQGQVWDYKTRKGEEASRIHVARVEVLKDQGPVYHILVDGLRIRNPHADSGIQETLPHLPVSEKSLDDSVISLVLRQEPRSPDVSEGYDAWKKAKGGVFSIPVADIVQGIEESLPAKDR